MNWGLILLIPIVFIMVTPAIFAVRSWILLLVWILLATVLQVWSELTLLMSVAGTGKKMNPIDAYKHSWPRLGAFFGLSILLFLVLLGATALLVIPGIILAIFLCFSVWTLVDENERGMDALLRSKHLVKDYWWPVFGRLFVLALVVGLFQAIISGILKAVGVPYFDEITSAILTFTAGPIAAVYTFLIYKNLKSIKGTAKATATSGERTGLIALAVLGFIAPVILVTIGMLFFVTATSTSFVSGQLVEDLQYELEEEIQTDMGMDLDSMSQKERKEYLRNLMGQ